MVLFAKVVLSTLALLPFFCFYRKTFRTTLIWGDNNKDQCIKKIHESGLIEYEEEWYNKQLTPQLKGAAYTAQCEQALMQGLDDEFMDEFEL